MPEVRGKWFLDAERIRWDRRTVSLPRAMVHCPSLYSLCVKTLAHNSRSLSESLISSLNPELLGIIWDELIYQQRDSLQLWFIFVQYAPSDILRVTPIYEVPIPASELERVPILLPRDVLEVYIHENSPIKGLSVVLTRTSVINLDLIKTIAATHSLISIDLRNGLWPSNANEIDRIIKHLVGSMHHGDLRSVLCLRLPEKGPMHLRNALRLEWPVTLRLLQCPVKPKDHTTAWRRCGIRDFNPAAGTVSIEVLGHGPYATSSYAKGLWRRI